MDNTRLFYVVMMVAFLIVYLIISKICETIQEIIATKQACRNITRVDINNKEDFERMMQEIQASLKEDE